VDKDIAKPTDGTGGGLIAFLSFASAKGYIKSSTISGFKSACRKILLATQGDEWESKSVFDLDIDALKIRFENLTRMDLGVGVRNTYLIRFKSSLDLYQDYLKDPSVPPTLSSRTRVGGPREKTTQVNPSFKRPGKPAKKIQPVSDVDPTKETGDIHDKETVKYPFPLRTGFMAYMTLPKDLTHREAKRLSAYIQSLAVDDLAYATIVSGELED
jgi:hypothetical protein